MAAGEAEMSFWDHLEVLRGTLFRSVLVITLVSVVVFCFKSLVFDDIILAPTKSDFFIYKWLRMGNMQKGTVWYNEKIIKQKEKERIVRRRDSFLFLMGYLLEKCRQNI